jgi:AcrR family transcriptional regulator
VLAAARTSFAEEGPDVPLDVIAERAGVGAGTVHRHFPTKEALIAAVVTDRLAGLAERATALADASEPVDAFFEFVRELTVQARENVVLSSALDGTELTSARAMAGADLARALEVLLERAQRARGVRPDLTVTDLHAVLSGVIAMERNLPPDHRGIGLDIVLAGLRPA